LAILEVHEYKQNYDSIASSIDVEKRSRVKIVSVSKSHPVEALINAYASGLRVFGENYVQEMLDKYNVVSDELKTGIEWHFIGHLQSNKVKYIAPFVNCIHSVDKLKLAIEIDKRAKENSRIIDAFLQVNSSGEDSKSGCEASEAEAILREAQSLTNINFMGLMTISGLESTDEERKQQFEMLSHLRDSLEERLKIKLPDLSMGMTDDYQLAIASGSTLIRIGTAIFGTRSKKI
jgi:pyridoxal phosphate enzyme (YggS family)